MVAVSRQVGQNGFWLIREEVNFQIFKSKTHFAQIKYSTEIRYQIVLVWEELDNALETRRGVGRVDRRLERGESRRLIREVGTIDDRVD